jgi:hypothetical protein
LLQRTQNCWLLEQVAIACCIFLQTTELALVFYCNITQSTLLLFPFVLFFYRIASILPQAFHPTAQNEWYNKDLKRTIITVQWWCINVESVVEWRRESRMSKTVDCCLLCLNYFDSNNSWLNVMIGGWLWWFMTDYDY